MNEAEWVSWAELVAGGGDVVEDVLRQAALRCTQGRASQELFHRHFAAAAVELLVRQEHQTQALRALSNSVTGASDLAGPFVESLLLKEEREHGVLSNILASESTAAKEAELVLLLNAASASPQASAAISTAPNNGRLLCLVLGIVSREMDRPADEEELEEQDETFGIAVALFRQLYAGGHCKNVWGAVRAETGVISGDRLVMLKLLEALPSSHTLRPFLIPALLQLQRLLAAPTCQGVPDERELQGLDLVAQLLGNEELQEIERIEQSGAKVAEVDEVTERETRLLGLCEPASALLLAVPSMFPGAVEPPRRTVATLNDKIEANLSQNVKGNIQRNLTRLLGIIASFPAGQMAVCSTGGLGAVLGLTKIDETNPTMREHALLTIRNCLVGCLENQEWVRQLQPNARIEDDGTIVGL